MAPVMGAMDFRFKVEDPNGNPVAFTASFREEMEPIIDPGGDAPLAPRTRVDMTMPGAAGTTVTISAQAVAESAFGLVATATVELSHL
jgi:hypothetical protein